MTTPEYPGPSGRSAEERALDALFARAAQDAPLAGSPARTAVIELPTGPQLLRAAGQVERRRRVLVGSVAVAAGLLLIGAIGGTTGAWRLPVPLIRGEGSDAVPATPDTRKGPARALEEVLAGTDPFQVTVAGPDTATSGSIVDAADSAVSWMFAAGPIVERDQDRPRTWPEADRSIRVAALPDSPGRWVVQLGPPDAEPPLPIEDGEWTTLGELPLARPGEPALLQVKPSEADGWLVAAALPPGAQAVQFRVAGTDQRFDVSDSTTACVTMPQGWGELAEGKSPGDFEDGVCAGQPPGTAVVVIARFVLDGDRPPLDAITYFDLTWKYFVVEAIPARPEAD